MELSKLEAKHLNGQCIHFLDENGETVHILGGYCNLISREDSYEMAKIIVELWNNREADHVSD